MNNLRRRWYKCKNCLDWFRTEPTEQLKDSEKICRSCSKTTGLESKEEVT